jgi:hypothetical protein
MCNFSLQLTQFCVVKRYNSREFATAPRHATPYAARNLIVKLQTLDHINHDQAPCAAGDQQAPDRQAAIAEAFREAVGPA